MSFAWRAESVLTRRDIERWRHRSTRRARFLVIAFVVGFLPMIFMMSAIAIQKAHEHGVPINVGDIVKMLLLGSICGLCFGGPLILVPCWILLMSGLSSYEQTMKSLRNQHRVCDLCQSVALFDDNDVYPSKHKGHTNADLIPHMNLIAEEGKTSVLCDKCLAEVNAIDSDE